MKKKKFARDGVRTHAHIRELELKSNALTTRPPGLYVNVNLVELIYKHIIMFIM
jgi:hypothetical protein